MAIIDGRHCADFAPELKCPKSVIEDAFDDVRRNSQAGQLGREGAA